MVLNYTINHSIHSDSVHVTKVVLVDVSSVLLQLRDFLHNILNIQLHSIDPSEPTRGALISSTSSFSDKYSRSPR